MLTARAPSVAVLRARAQCCRVARPVQIWGMTGPHQAGAGAVWQWGLPNLVLDLQFAPASCSQFV